MIAINNNNSSINLINSIGKTEDKKEGSVKFTDILKDAVADANKLKIEADKLTEDYIVGKSDNLHEVMIASQKAEISVMFVTEVRSRLMDAYQEFMKMQM